MKCPKCGTENKDTAKFCKGCGEKLKPSSSQDTSSQVMSSPVNSASEPKGNKKLLIICATAIICVIIIAGAFLALNSSENSGISSNANSALGVDNSDSSSDYYQYDFKGYTFNIPSDYQHVSDDFDSETLFNMVTFENDNGDFIDISVRNNVPNLNKDTVKDLAGQSDGNLILADETFANINGWGGDIENSTITGHMFGFYSGDDIIIIGVYLAYAIDISHIEFILPIVITHRKWNV